GYLGAKRVAAFRLHLDLIAIALSGSVASLALYGGIALMSAAHQSVPATHLAALPVACATGALGTTLGYSVATRVREGVRLRSAAETGDLVRELVTVGPNRRSDGSH